MPSLALIRAVAFGTLAPQPSIMAALNHMGFLQADPIRSPARAQDLTLMQRVADYKTGDLERLYPTLGLEEDLIPNYGFVPRAVQAILHPREVMTSRVEQSNPDLLPDLLSAVRDLLQSSEELHPKEVAAILGKNQIMNAWGGQSSATTRALDVLHYKGEARVTRRIAGIRLYGPAPHLQAIRENPLPEAERLRRAIYLLVALYGPLPEVSLGRLVYLSGSGFPHLRTELRLTLKQMLKEELQSATVDGLKYVWNADFVPEDNTVPQNNTAPEASRVRIVGPFDPLVWDRRRFEHLHGWVYKFEAYTPAKKRKMGYYAMPLFYAEKAIGWANLKVEAGELKTELGFSMGFRQTAAFKKELEAELERYRHFLGLV